MNNPDTLPVLIRNSELNQIYGGGSCTTAITVTGFEQITVTGAGGTPVFTWP